MPADLQSAPFGRSGTDPGANTLPLLRRTHHTTTARYPRRMPSFDVVSEIDMQEVRNAVDQATREVSNRYDFKGTDSTIDLSESEITLRSVSEDRLAALRQVLEEKLVKRKVSLKSLDYGKVEEASGG